MTGTWVVCLVPGCTLGFITDFELTAHMIRDHKGDLG